MRLEQVWRVQGKLSQAGGPESHGTCSYCLAFSSSSNSHSLMGIPHDQLLQEANKGNQAPESLIHLHGLPFSWNGTAAALPLRWPWGTVEKKESSERAGFGVCTLFFTSYVSKDKLSTDLYLLYLFIYLTVLDLSCDKQDLKAPDQGSNPSPLLWKCSLSHQITKEVPQDKNFKKKTS